MKRSVFALIFILISGIILANAPPGNDYVVQSDQYELQMTIDQPATAIELQATEVILPYISNIWHGGLVLEVDVSSWSAIISNDYYINQVAVRNANRALYSLGQNTTTLNKLKSRDNFLGHTSNTGQEVEVLDIGEVDATWRYQETYS